MKKFSFFFYYATGTRKGNVPVMIEGAPSIDIYAKTQKEAAERAFMIMADEAYNMVEGCSNGRKFYANQF